MTTTTSPPGSSATGGSSAIQYDRLFGSFLVPGELWCHLLTASNHYATLLRDFIPPVPGEPPLLVNVWQHLSPFQHSPYRIVYGNHNPALRGIHARLSLFFGMPPSS